MIVCPSIGKISQISGEIRMLKPVPFTWATCIVVLLTACGGSGVPLSVTQQNFEATTKSDYFVAFDWSLPTANVAPTTGTHYFYYTINSVLSSPSTGPVADTNSQVNLASTLSAPDFSQMGVDRVLQGGVIYTMNQTTKRVWSYSGDDMLLTTYATDNATPLYTAHYDAWSAAVPLTGTIAATSVLKQFLGFSRLNTLVNFDFTKSWLAGSSYFTRKGFQQADTLFLYDWSGKTYDSAVMPWGGTETTIEALFANAAFAAAGGITMDSVAYPLNAGTISSIQGARVWVATNPRPASAYATTGYVAFAELNGKIYWGMLRKAGARFNVIDGVDTTLIDDYNIRLNSYAVQSIKSAVKF